MMTGMMRGPGGSSMLGGGITTTITGREPLTLIPDQKSKWIIAKGPRDSIELVREWILRFDVEDPITTEYETIPIIYGNPSDIADAIDAYLMEFPNIVYESSVMVRPLDSSMQILVFGSENDRKLVQEIISTVDVPIEINAEKKVFKLIYADPDLIQLYLKVCLQI